MTDITLTKIPLNAGARMPAAKAIASDGAKIQFNEQDMKTLIILENTSAAAETVTFKKGTGIQGVADMSVSLPANSSTGFVLESGAFKSKGCVYAEGATAVKISAVVLP